MSTSTSSTSESTSSSSSTSTTTIPATCVLDQSQTTGSANGFGFGTTSGPMAAQTFTPSFSALICSVTLRLTVVGNPTDKARVSIYSVDGSGNPLALIANSDYDIDIPSLGNYSFPFVTSSTLLYSGTQYAIVLSRSGSDDSSNFYRAIYSTSNPYPGGVCCSYNGSAWTLYPTLDINFSEYYDNTSIITTSTSSSTSSTSTSISTSSTSTSTTVSYTTSTSSTSSSTSESTSSSISTSSTSSSTSTSVSTSSTSQSESTSSSISTSSTSSSTSVSTSTSISSSSSSSTSESTSSSISSSSTSSSISTSSTSSSTSTTLPPDARDKGQGTSGERRGGSSFIDRPKFVVVRNKVGAE